MKTSAASLRQELLRSLLALVTLGWVLSPAVSLAQSENPMDYVLLANTSVRFARDGVIATGNVAVSASMAQGGGILIADRQLVAGDDTHIVSDSTEFRNPSSIYSLFSNEASIAAGVIVRDPCGSGACAFPPPVLNPFPSLAAITAGTTAVTVPPRTTVTLTAGNYGKVKVRARGTVVFTGGVYNLAEFKTGKIARVLFTAPTTVNVAGRLQFGAFNVVGPIGPGVSGLDILFQCTGDKVRIKPRSTVSARVWAPASPVFVGYGGIIKGQIVAGDAKVDRGVVFQSVFPSGTFEVRDTPTQTPTRTAPPTYTPSSTYTPSETATPADTATETPVPTDTPIPTATDTSVPTATNTAVPTATNTALPTATNTAGFTATNTPVASATNTPVASATNTPVASATNTPVASATNTPVASATNTPVASATNTAVPTNTATPQPTATATKTVTFTKTRTFTPTATPPGPLTQAVVPISECVIQNGPNSYTAYFGYRNDSTSTATIPIGPNNFFSPAPQDRGQGTTFQPGLTAPWPNSPFSVSFDGTDLTWTLTGPDGITRSATANSASTLCSEHVFLQKKWYDVSGHLLANPPANLPANYTLTAASSLGTATCSYSGGALQCTYDNGGLDSNGLWVPAGESYSVSEFNLPSDYQALAGVGSFPAQVPGGYCVNPYLGQNTYCLHNVKNIAFNGCSSSISLETSGYEQVNYITQILDGTVTQIGGAAPGTSMTTAADFQGTASATTGVNVGAPAYLFASSAPAFDLTGSSQPGNVPAVALGAPTDLTFTVPGIGGPDGTDGDGSLILGSSGNFITLGFGSTLCISGCRSRSVILFTDAGNAGTAQIQLLNAGSPVATTTATFASGGTKSAIGGVVFDINNITFDQVKITRLAGTLKIDAVAVAASACGGLLEAAVCGDGILQIGEECDDGNTKSGDGCSSECRNEYDLTDGSHYCTLTQDGWAGPEGSVFIARDPGVLPVTIGGPGYSTTISTESALQSYLPKSGTPHALFAGKRQFNTDKDVVDDGSGALGGQTVALSLALGLSSSGEVFENFGTFPLPPRSFCTQGLAAGDDGLIGTADDVLDPSSAITGPWSIPPNVAGINNSVSDLMLMATQYLRGSISVATRSEVNSALDTINKAFDGCRQIVPCQ